MLEIKGRPSGAIYLERGQVAFAHASWVPGLTSRLRGALQPTEELLELLRRWDQADPGIAELVVRRHYISSEELHALVGSIVVDAFVFLTAAPASESHVSAIRFDSAGASWPDSFPRMKVASVRTEAAWRAERVMRCDLAPSTPIALNDSHRSATILTRERWELACRIHGAMSALDLAQQCGLALADTIEGLGSLLQSGLCVRAPGGLAARVPTRRSAPALPAELIPPTRRGDDQRNRPDPGTPPSMDILRQVLNGLRKLS